jgi:hypothetical protein
MEQCAAYYLSILFAVHDATMRIVLVNYCTVLTVS